MVIVRVQHHKVSFLSYLDTADAVGPVQGGCSVQREGGYGFFDTHLHIDTCQRKGQRDRTGETTAGVEVGGQCYGTARINHLAPAGIRLFQGKGGKREQCGNHAFIRHGTDVGIGSMQQVVGGDGGEFRSQPRTAQRYDFIGMEFQCQSHFTGGGQQAAGLSDREHALLAKDIAKLCQPVLNNGGHDFTDNEIHVIVRASIVFLRHCMRAQKRRNDVHTLVLVIVQTAHHAELQQLGFLVQAVAALALDGGNSHSAHLLQEALCLGAQLDKVALTRSFHCTDNAIFLVTLHHFVYLCSNQYIKWKNMNNNNNQIIRFDWAMKRLLRNKANFSVLEGLLTTLLGEKIVIQKLLESESNQEDEYDKYNRVDMLAENSKGELVLIEVQNNNEYAYFQRMLFGTSKLVTEYINRGESYDKVRKVYSVNIVYFSLGHGTDFVYHGKTEFRGIHQGDILELTPFQKQTFKVDTVSQLYPEYYILKVNGFDQVAKSPLEEWIYYLNTGEIPSSATAPGLEEARERLKLDSMTKDELAAYYRHLDNIVILRDNIYTEREEGRAEGEKQKAIKVASYLKQVGSPTELIIGATGLSKEEVEKL